MILETFANIAEILTAVVAVLASSYYWSGQRTKRQRLEQHLKNEKINNPTKSQHTTLYLVAKLGLTEDEILRASFKSKHIRRPAHADPKTGLTDELLFEWTD